MFVSLNIFTFASLKTYNLNMKTKFFTVLAATAALLTSCGEASSTDATNTVVVDSAAVYNVDVTASKVEWKGEVAGVYGHHGYVNFASGKLNFNDSALAGGELVVDMKNIFPTDSGYTAEKGHGKADLVAHLSTRDFFATDSFPTATFVIKSVEGNTVKGLLTVRGKSNEETFNITSMKNENGVITATGTLVFDRQKYDVAWKHYMKDMILSDNISLNISVVAKK